MRINEFFKPENDNELPFNVVDDLSIYMRNDPMFYRKNFFPAVVSMKNAFDNKKTLDPNEVFEQMIEKAVLEYCKKFNIPKRPEELLDDEEKTSLIRKLYSEELANIRKGVY